MDTALLSSRSNFFLTQSLYDEQAIRTLIGELREIIIEHNKRYYHTSDPIISDGEYDQLFALLQQREDQYPELIVDGTPTQGLVGQKLEGFSSATHLSQMGSLQNTYSADHIHKRDDGLRRIQTKQSLPDWTYIVEPKIDGMSVELVYAYGRFVRAVTRGDGLVGEDVTEHAKLLNGLPGRVDGLRDIPVISFRGEVVLPKAAFTDLGETKTTGGTQFANARNAAAGTLRQLDTSLVKKRQLSVYIYDILYIEGHLDCQNASEQFTLFRQRKLPVLEMIEVFSSRDDLVAYCLAPETKTRSDHQPVDLDGLVIKINEFAIREQFGITNHHPKWAIAYKFPAQQIATQLIDVQFQVGRTGVLTPVAYVTPVQLSGVTISKATLHNRSFIQERSLQLNDWVMLQRSGEVIPYIVATLLDRRDGSQRDIVQPVQCPVCAHDVFLDEDAGTLWCGNVLCDAQIKQRLEHAVSKGCLDISGLGPRLIDLMVNAGLLTTIADIFTLTVDGNKQHLSRLPGVADKKIIQLDKEFHKKRPWPLRRVLNALSIRHIGEVSSRDIATHFFVYKDATKESLSQFFAYVTDTDLISSIHGFGTEMVRALEAFFCEPEHQRIFTRLDELGVIDRQMKKTIESDNTLLAGMSIVLTGSFVYERDLIKNFLIDQGAVIQASVNTKTNALLAGDGGGSKRQKAEELGVRIRALVDFFDHYGLTLDLLDVTNIGVRDAGRGEQASLFG